LGHVGICGSALCDGPPVVDGAGVEVSGDPPPVHATATMPNSAMTVTERASA
jgi:hypothetical protein